MDVFPFTSEFAQLYTGQVSRQYLESVKCMLEPVIDFLYGEVVEQRVTEVVAKTLLVASVAHGRVVVALAYCDDVALVDEQRWLAMVDAEWKNYVSVNELLDVSMSSAASGLLQPMVATLWRAYSVSTVATVADLCRLFGPSVVDLKVVKIGDVYVESDKGVVVSSLVGENRLMPVLPRDAYLSVLQGLKLIPAEGCGPAQLYESVQGCGFESYSTARFPDWCWLVRVSTQVADGYCYQYLLEPMLRFNAVRALGRLPTVAKFLALVRNIDVRWAGGLATFDIGSDCMHVCTAGDMDERWLSLHSDMLIGGSPRLAEPDYYAKAMVDAFFERHRARNQLALAPPVDAALGQLTLAPLTTGERGFVDVASMFYNGVGESLSPRARAGLAHRTGMVSTDYHVSGTDSERVRMLYSRLDDGAVVDEGYFIRTRRRFSRGRHRPRLDASDGRSCHVFAGFPADTGGSTDCWQLDDAWDVPGWKSYVAHFREEERTVCFVAPDDALDVRVDCSGEGLVDLGSCQISIKGTVFWFTKSVKMKVSTKARACLRVSVPDSGSATAIGKDMRRYMHLPGYALAVVSYAIERPGAELMFTVGGRQLVSGCEVRSGEKQVERGRHKFKLSGLSSEACVKLVVKTVPVDALSSVTVCGVRVTVGSRDYLTVLYDVRNNSCYLSLQTEAIVRMSVCQVVDNRQFDSVARSICDARVQSF